MSDNLSVLLYTHSPSGEIDPFDSNTHVDTTVQMFASPQYGRHTTEVCPRYSHNKITLQKQIHSVNAPGGERPLLKETVQRYCPHSHSIVNGAVVS